MEVTNVNVEKDSMGMELIAKVCNHVICYYDCNNVTRKWRILLFLTVLSGINGCNNVTYLCHANARGNTTHIHVCILLYVFVRPGMHKCAQFPMFDFIILINEYTVDLKMFL